MKKTIIIVLLLAGFLGARHSQAQEMGVSFSFFFPKDGYFSAPISPFSLRGLGFNITRNLAIESGFSLYRMSGMNVSGLDFETKEPIVGPFFNLMVPAELILQFGNESFEFRLKGGGFAFYNFGTKLNYGNFDRAIRSHLSWEVANAQLDYDNKVGFGYEFGTEIISYFTRSFGISIGANYYVGGAEMNLRGSVSGGSEASPIRTVRLDYPGSKLDYTGLEISMGVIFTPQ